MENNELFEFFSKYGSYILWFDDKPNEFPNVLQSLNKHHIPTCIFEDLPNDPDDQSLICYFKNASTLLLDYAFRMPEMGLVNQLGLSGKQEEDNECIRKLISVFCENSFSPIFLLTNDPIRAEESIIKNLDERFSKRVFVFGKSEIRDDFAVDVKQRISNNFSDTQNEARAFYAWSKSLDEAKFKVFKDLFYDDPNWISSIYIESMDGNDSIVDEEHDFNFSSFLNQNLLSRYRFPSFSSLFNDNPKNPDSQKVIRMFKSLRTEKYETPDCAVNFWRSGDIFLIPFSKLQDFRGDLKLDDLFNKLACNRNEEDSDPYFYVINISAACSMSRGNAVGTFLIGAKCPMPSFKNEKARRDEFISTINKVSRTKFIGFLDEECVSVSFQFILHIDSSKISNYYKGRLLDPYLSQLRNNFTSYLNRVGVLCEELGALACEVNNSRK